jgi:hypothetical protein
VLPIFFGGTTLSDADFSDKEGISNLFRTQKMLTIGRNNLRWIVIHTTYPH